MFGQVERRSKSILVQRERDRIKKNEKMTDRLAELESFRHMRQRADFERSNQADSAKARRHGELARQRESELAHRAILLVRRAALTSLLEDEHQQYAAELNQRGKAIYQQRE